MLALCIRLAAAIHGYCAFYMPTNRAVWWLRSPHGIKWAIPAALVATPTYLFAMSVCMTIIERGGPGYLNVLVMLFAWNAIKFAAAGVVTVPSLVVESARRLGRG
ncbi:MAG: sulfate permease [Acidimicrobiia bacterium]